MEKDVLLGKYEIEWTNVAEKSFTANIIHINKNTYGGIWATPVGLLVGFMDERPKKWTVKIITRSDIKYNQVKNKTFVFAKSAFKIKVEYYFEKLQDVLFPNFRVDPKLEEGIKNLLLNKKMCHEPFSISMSEEKIKSFRFHGATTFEDLD